MSKRSYIAFVLALPLAAVLLASATVTVDAATLSVCHGYNCAYRKALPLSGKDEAGLSAIMSAGAKSAEAERKAVAKAIAYLEKRATTVIGVKDLPKASLAGGGKIGQMDCLDESANSTTYMKHLEARNLLSYHTVQPVTARGIMIDGRYPHSTAVLKDKAGKVWAVDSWYEPGGGEPDIMEMSEWRERGVGGAR